MKLFMNLVLPSSFQLKKKAKSLDSQTTVQCAPNGIVGVQQSLRTHLTARLTKLVEHCRKDGTELPDTICVKLTGDGTLIARGLTVVNVAFTILDEGQRACSVCGNYSLGIFKVSESYDNLVLALEDNYICAEARDLELITIDDKVFKIQFYLGGDWKFLATVCGIDSATLEYACIWCKCPKRQRSDMTLKWSITDVTKGARTNEEIAEKYTLPKSSKHRYSCSRKPVFSFIPLHRVIIDSLHHFF